MPLKDELARFVSQRCEEIGLSADRLAHIAAVDRQVIDDLFARRNTCLDVSVAERIANVVGLGLGVLGQRPRRVSAKTAADVAAQVASTSYRDPLLAGTLLQALTSGVIPHDFRPHIRTLLDEAPVGLLARLADELQGNLGEPTGKTWRTMRSMAASLKCYRDIWN